MMVSSSVKLWEALSIPLNKLIHFSYIPFQISFTDWQTLVYPFVQCVTSLDKTSFSWSLYLTFFNLLWDSYIFLQVQQFELHTVYQCRRTLVLQNQRKIFVAFLIVVDILLAFFFFLRQHMRSLSLKIVCDVIKSYFLTCARKKAHQAAGGIWIMFAVNILFCACPRWNTSVVCLLVGCQSQLQKFALQITPNVLVAMVFIVLISCKNFVPSAHLQISKYIYSLQKV